MRLVHKVSETGNALQAIAISCRHHETPYLPAVIEAFRLYWAQTFSLREIIGYELFQPDIARSMPIMISKHESLSRMEKINPRNLERRVEDKSVFYLKCQSTGLPIPESYGVFRVGKGYAGNNDPIMSRDEWLAYFEAQLPQHFVVKDVEGVYGSGFQVFSRTDTGFKTLSGEDFSVLEFYALLEKNSTDGLIIQERLFNHPGVVLCDQNTGLSTLRVNTLLEDDGNVNLVFYILKVPVGHNTTDNFAMGKSGNLIAFGGETDGVLQGARMLKSSGVGLTTISKHPLSERDIEGFSIPLWQEAVELAKRAHRQAFSEFGTLGWDIALTLRGPVLIEANPWWDPPMYAPQVMSNENWQRIFG